MWRIQQTQQHYVTDFLVRSCSKRVRRRLDVLTLARSCRKVLTLSAISLPPKLSATQRREKCPQIFHHEGPENRWSIIKEKYLSSSYMMTFSTYFSNRSAVDSISYIDTSKWLLLFTHLPWSFQLSHTLTILELTCIFMVQKFFSNSPCPLGLGVGVESSAGGSVSYTISEIRQVMVGKKNEQTTPQKWRIIR